MLEHICALALPVECLPLRNGLVKTGIVPECLWKQLDRSTLLVVVHLPTSPLRRCMVLNLKLTPMTSGRAISPKARHEPRKYLPPDSTITGSASICAIRVIDSNELGNSLRCGILEPLVDVLDQGQCRSLFFWVSS